MEYRIGALSASGSSLPASSNNNPPESSTHALPAQTASSMTSAPAAYSAHTFSAASLRPMTPYESDMSPE